MKLMALIPARGGSVRFPGKNLAELGGTSLLARTIKSAKDTKLFDEIVVSSDDPIIGVTALTKGVISLVRPKELAQDDTPSLPVVLHALENHPADVVVLLQVTSPFRTIDDIQQSLNLFLQRDADAVISVTAPPKDEVFKVGHAGRLRPSEGVMIPNGAIYIATAQHLRHGENWYSGLVYAYVMPKARSLDIDTPMDLEIARMMLRGEVLA